MDTSESELQELRRLLGELTARVFRIEQGLNLQPGLPRPVSPVETPPPSPPPSPPYQIRTDLPPTPQRVSPARTS